MPADQKGTIVPDHDAQAASATYDPACRRCPRLAAFLGEVKIQHPQYWCKPVPPFGAATARLLVVGLAPGMHGANASGRPFTGDYAGILLYETLHAYGFATQPVATARDDGQELVACRITNAVKCLPPGNKPTPAEVRTCNGYLAADLAQVPVGGAILALGFCETYGNSGRGCTERTAFGVMGAGAGVGFIIGALAKMGIKSDPIEAHIPGEAPKEAKFLDKVTPTIMPTQGGGLSLGLAGEL